MTYFALTGIGTDPQEEVFAAAEQNGMAGRSLIDIEKDERPDVLIDPISVIGRPVVL